MVAREVWHSHADASSYLPSCACARRMRTRPPLSFESPWLPLLGLPDGAAGEKVNCRRQSFPKAKVSVALGLFVRADKSISYSIKVRP